MRFYTDENVPLAVTRGLRLRGIDVLTTQEAAMCGTPDEEQLGFAQQQGCVLITQDDDFLRFHAAEMPHSGIVYARQHTPIGTIIQGVMLISQVLETNDMQNHVEFV